jgi:hypothetical protein
MHMKLIDEAKQAWRMLSVQCMGAALALQVTWAQLPQDLKDAIPHQWVAYATVALLVLGVLGRLVKQDLPGGKDAGQ